MIKSLLILALGCLIVLGVYAADGIRQVIGGTDTVGSIGLANLPVGVVTNGYTPIFTNTTIKLGSGAFNSPSYGFTASATDGILYTGSRPTFQVGSSYVLSLAQALMYLAQSTTVGYGNNNDPSVASAMETYYSRSTTGTWLFSTNAIFKGAVTSTNGLASYRSNLVACTSITIGASPVNWTNTLGVNCVVYVDGISVTGTVGINGGTIFSTIGQNTVLLQNGEYATITFTIGTPTACFKPF